MDAPRDLLDVSLNEVETFVQKAARGAGLPWGVAEDTGRAAAWIARRVGDWACPLLALLQMPPPDQESPLLLAGWLADAARPCRIHRVAFPLWALPGLLATARRPISIRIADAELRCSPGEVPSATCLPEELAAIASGALTVEFPGAPMPPLPHRMQPSHRRSLVPVAAWRRLEALAHRTYVPASDHSRRTGAGAGLLDDE